MAIEEVSRLLLQLSRLERPNEACGFLAWDGTGLHVMPCENIAAEPEHSYVIAPQDQRRYLEMIERKGWMLWGAYHSHPNEGGKPSERDRGLAEAWPSGTRMVIIGLTPADGEPELYVGDPL